jgi:glycosyltransferase involved in cell wall biosynthesis
MRHHNLLYTSSYDRGLDILLYLWSDIKKEVPDAKLFIAYGWDLFDIVARGNPERQEWKRGVELLMQQKDVYHLGRIGKDELKKVRQQCGILAYPSYFLEINCLSIIEGAKEGVVPVSVDIGAIKETLNHGIFIKGDIRKKEVQEEYKKALISLMKDKKEWERLSYRCQKEARKYEIDKIADKWIDVFNEPIEDIKVSIITPTIREGFWDSMAKNISSQSYKNIEWIIVDDYKEDREKIAEKYAKKYSLNIKYIRGDKAKGVYKRRLGLVRANNLGWKASTGELLVWLQDFVYMDTDAIESIVDLYRHNKDCLIAPVDIYYEPVNVDKTNKEDWFNEKAYQGKKVWKNIRVKYQGIRESDNPFDFEMNFGSIPKHILDKLNGFWEFFDEGLGYDNTEICLRAMKLGYKLLIDDSIIGRCLNLWQVIKGSPLNISGRDRLLNPPRYIWMTRQMEKGKLPIVRDEKIDDKINLYYEIPKEIKDEDCAKWIENHQQEIVKSWEGG